MKRATPTGAGPDGIQRTSDQEHRINGAFVDLFGGPNGTFVLNYLKSITINSVAGPEQSDSALRHLEGGRYIVGLISQRIELGVLQRKGNDDV